MYVVSVEDLADRALRQAPQAEIPAVSAVSLTSAVS
jgi:hypothetical protein